MWLGRGVAPAPRIARRGRSSVAAPGDGGYRRAAMRRAAASRRALAIGALLGAAVIFLRVALPLLHTLGIEMSEAQPPAAGIWAVAGGPVHDAGSCPICRALAQPASTAAAAPQVAGGQEVAPVVPWVAWRTPPPGPAAHQDARAPPAAPFRVS